MLADAKAFATLPAENLERALKFYTEVLGLKLRNSDAGNAMLDAGEGSQIFMYQRARTKAEHTALSFAVADIEATVKDLIEKGVAFEQYDFGEIKTNHLGIAEIGPTKSAWLIDTEGNIIAIVNN